MTRMLQSVGSWLCYHGFHYMRPTRLVDGGPTYYTCARPGCFTIKGA